jgi:hypothetical protein
LIADHPYRKRLRAQLMLGSLPLRPPALAMAMAIARDEDGGAEIERWSQAVTIVSAG